VIEGHHVGDDDVGFRQRGVFVENADVHVGGARAAGGEREDVEIGVLRVLDEDEVFEHGCLAEELGGLGVSKRIFGAGILDEGKLGGGGGGGYDHAAAGVFAVKPSQRIAAKFRLDDVFDDLGVAQNCSWLGSRRSGLWSAGSRRRFAGNRHAWRDAGWQTGRFLGDRGQPGDEKHGDETME